MVGLVHVAIPSGLLPDMFTTITKSAEPSAVVEDHLSVQVNLFWMARRLRLLSTPTPIWTPTLQYKLHCDRDMKRDAGGELSSSS